jgi:hypothetical protein
VMLSSSLPLSSSSDATLEPGLDPKQAVRWSRRLASWPQSLRPTRTRAIWSRVSVSSLGAYRHSSPFVMQPSLPPPPISTSHRNSRPHPRLQDGLGVTSPGAALPTCSYLHHEFHARTHGRTRILFSGLRTSISWTARIAQTWPLSGSTHIRQSRVSALSHSSFTYYCIITS